MYHGADISGAQSNAAIPPPNDPAQGQGNSSLASSVHDFATLSFFFFILSTRESLARCLLDIYIMPPTSQEDAPNMMLLSRLRAALRQFQSSGRAFQLVADETRTTPRRCRTLVVLDSSFNPPTIAHMAMATSAVRGLQEAARRRRDKRAAAAAAALGGEEGGKGTTTTTRHGVDDDDIRLLLLLAVNNADKAPKPASFEHRLLMMRAFAKDIQQASMRRAREQQEGHDGEQQQDGGELPVDIGLTTHPYFHDKSAVIARAAEYEFVTTTTPSSSPTPTTTTQHIFLAGYDTLIRIFNPKYYDCSPQEGAGAGDGDKKTAMQTCLDPFLARATLRVTMRTDQQADWGGRAEQMGYVDKMLRGDGLEKVGGRRAWAQRVEMVEAMAQDEDGVVVSSTEAREAVQSKNWDKVRRLVPEGVAGLIEQGEVQW